VVAWKKYSYGVKQQTKINIAAYEWGVRIPARAVYGWDQVVVVGLFEIAEGAGWVMMVLFHNCFKCNVETNHSKLLT